VRDSNIYSLPCSHDIGDSSTYKGSFHYKIAQKIVPLYILICVSAASRYLFKSVYPIQILTAMCHLFWFTYSANLFYPFCTVLALIQFKYYAQWRKNLLVHCPVKYRYIFHNIHLKYLVILIFYFILASCQ
jgi:hypothetical protein